MSHSMPQVFSRETARKGATGLAALRGAVGVAAWVIPAQALRPWVGSVAANSAGGRLLGRSLGARDIALGAGALLSERHDTPVRGWLEAGALADVGDLIATLYAFRKLPKLTRWGVLGLTAGAAVAGGLLAPCVDEAG